MLTQTQNHRTMMVQLNKGKNVKHLITILLLTISLNVTAAAEPQEIPDTESGTVIILVPESIEPEAAATPNLTPEECRTGGAKLRKLIQVVDASDEKASEMRAGMKTIVSERIVPMLTIQPDWALVQTIMNQYAEITYQYGLLIVERDKAYDASKALLDELNAGCNYKPEGDS